MAVVEVITGGKKVENVIVGVPQPMSPPGALPPDIGYVEISTSDDRGSIWDTGEGPPTTPASQPGDMYLDVDTGDIYRWNGTEWVLEGNFAPGTDTPEEILAKLITVDGEGSLLDADTLDGHDSTYFATDADLDAANIAISSLDGRLDNVEIVNDGQDDRLDAIEADTTDWTEITGKPIPQSDVANLVSDLALKAPLASPTFTGDPKAPTPGAADNDTSVATTAYVTTAIATQKATDTTDYVNVTGDTMTGNLNIYPAANSYLTLKPTTGHVGYIMDKPVGAFANTINGRVAGLNRWVMYMGNTTAETGSNAGSNFTLYRHDDAGAVIDIPISINRASGKVAMLNGATLESGKAALSEAPVDGLTYGRKDATWATIVGGAIVSDTPPVGPAPGQMWYEADSGNTYIWYSDADSSQWVQQNIAAPISGLQPGLTAETRNRIVNGAMQISQENADTAGTTHLYHAADQFYVSVVTGGAYSFQRVASVTPSGSKYRLRCTVTTIDAAIAAGDVASIATKIEGIHIADLMWGTPQARQLVVRFGWKSPAGTYGFSIRYSGQSYVALFTISAGQANTDTEQVIVVPGNTTTANATDTAVGLNPSWALMAGTTYQGAAGWSTANILTTSAQTNGFAAVNNTFELFDVGLYLDPLNTGVPPRWQMPDEAEELRACQRYWQIKPMYNYWYAAASNVFYVRTHLPVQMRTAPATSLASGSSITYVNASTLNATAHGVDCVTFFATTTAAGTASAAWNAAINARM